WLAAVHGLGGMRHHGESLGFSPRLPRGIRKLTFRVIFLGRLLRVSFDHRQATYSLVRGRPITFDHYGKAMRLAPGRSAVRRIPGLKAPPEPTQPSGPAPARRGPPRPRTPRPRPAKAERTYGRTFDTRR